MSRLKTSKKTKASVASFFKAALIGSVAAAIVTLFMRIKLSVSITARRPSTNRWKPFYKGFSGLELDPPVPSPAWYQDPVNKKLMRYRDGQAWGKEAPPQSGWSGQDWGGWGTEPSEDADADGWSGLGFGGWGTEPSEDADDDGLSGQGWGGWGTEPSEDSDEDGLSGQGWGGWGTEPSEDADDEIKSSNPIAAPAPPMKARLTLFKAGAPPLETVDDAFARSITDADKEAVDKAGLWMLMGFVAIMAVMMGGVVLLFSL